MASILIPNLGAVMLWQTLRSTAIRLSIGLAHWFRSLTAHKRHPVLKAVLPAAVDGEEIKASFKVKLPKEPVAQKPEKAAA